MRVSLKKARRIETAFADKLESLETSSVWAGNGTPVVTHKADAIDSANEKFAEIESLALKLVAGINEIRDKIRQANEQSSVNQKIQSISALEREKKVLEFLDGLSVRVNYGPPQSDRLNSRESVVVTKDMERRINELKFTISELKDSTNGQNASLEIELSSATQEVAEQLGIPL